MEMNAPTGLTPLDQRADGAVGKPLDRVDGRLKVTGRATYAAEYAGEGKTAYGFLVQSTVAKGRITTLDTAAAERAPGVLAVLTYKNAGAPSAPKEQKDPQGSGGGNKGVPQLSSDRVDHHGQPVALVVAETFEQARAGAFLVRVSYAREPHAAEMKPMLGAAIKPKGNRPPDTVVGDFPGAFAAAPVKVDATYTTPDESHAMMEPHSTIAEWNGDQLTLYTSNQMISQGQGSVAATLQIPKEKVRLVSRYIGGGFGAKLSVWADAILAALAAKKLGRPVKVVLTRQQVFAVTGHRPETIQRLRLGATPDGKLTAVGHECWSSNNPEESFFETAAVATRTLYAGPNRMTAHRLVKLDIPVSTSMRAPGEAVGLLALECAMDELAERLELDPVEFRIRNDAARDPETGKPFSTRALVPCLQEGARRFGWGRRRPQPGQVREGRWLVGLGVASATRGNILRPSKCRLTLNPDGTATARMAMTDIGTGSYTIFTQITADMLGLPVERVTVMLGDTDFPETAGSGGSFGAASAGSALYAACDLMRAELAARAGLDPAQATLRGGRITAGSVSRSLAELAASGPLDVVGEIKPGRIVQDTSQQSYGAQFAEVGVDADTGEIRLRRMLSVCAAGRILNEKTARSQCLGGMVMGLGAALTEELVRDPRFGHYVNHDLAEYHVPVNADVPKLEVVFLPERDDKANPLKAKGVGELGICGVGAAVANAVYNACGVRIREFPLTLDKVLVGLAHA